MGFLFDTLLCYLQLAFLSGSVGKNNLPAMQETWVQSWVGKIPGGGPGNSLQCSCLENPMDREA